MGAIGQLRATVSVARERNLTFLAAGLVYYVFTSIPPLVLLALAVGSAVVGPTFTAALVNQVSDVLSAGGERLVEQALGSGRGRTGASVAGLALLAWSGLKLFRGLQVAFDEVYGVADDPSLVVQFRNGLLVTATTTVVVALLAASGAVFARPSVVGVPYAGVLGTLGLLVGLVAAFVPLYYVFPPVEMSLGKALPGAVVAALGWVLLQVSFQLYAANASRYAAWGLLGAVLLFVTWLYVAGVVVLLGAAFNAVRGGDTAPGDATNVPTGRRPTATRDAPHRR